MAKFVSDYNLPTLERLRKEIDAQDGTDPDSEDLTTSEWDKVKATTLADFGSEVEIIFVPDKGFEDCEPRIDHGYLTALPDRDDSWDMVGIVHIPTPWGEKDQCPPEWHSLYSLCKNPEIAEIIIGPRVCDKAPDGWQCSRATGHTGPCAAHPVS